MHGVKQLHYRSDLYYSKQTRNSGGKYQKAMVSGSLVTGCKDNVLDQPTPTTALLLTCTSTDLYINQ
jgi:ABC-type cobalamin/Fe3+-siderophores transport system ATPase subunit